MIDGYAKDCLRDELRRARAALVWKLDGLSEYDIRRPLTATGTNLLGLVKHAATWEARYFGEVFDRPFSELLPEWDFAGGDLWATADETRVAIVDFYRRVSEHADRTITELPIDAAGHVWWWPRPDVKLFGVLVHVLGDTNRHAGHADILREQIDGQTGVGASQQEPIDTSARATRCEVIEAAAAAASQTN